MLRRIVITWALVLLAVTAAVGGQTVDPGRGEIHPIHTTTLTDAEILLGQKVGVEDVVAGELRLPRGTERGTDKVPAIVLVHGSGGIGPGVYQWAREFNNLGIATFVLDGFTGRGLTNVREEQAQLGMLSMIVDAYRTLEVLAKHPRIDARRIAIMGGSRGGQIALFTSLRRFHRAYGPADVTFAAHIVFYASCQVAYREELDVLDRPIRFFHGSADQASRSCKPYADRLRAAGKDVEFMEFEGLHHAFAEPVGRVFQEQGQTRRDCDLEEHPGGLILNRATGQAFSWNDACVRRGVTFETNEEARAVAFARIRALLSSVFGLKLQDARPPD